MKTINIDKEVLDLTPQEFKNLPADLSYRLTKKEDHRDFSLVGTGDSVTGSLSIVNVKDLGLPGVRVANEHRMWNYIRTSPIVKVLKCDQGFIIFQTQGGVYLLEILSS